MVVGTGRNVRGAYMTFTHDRKEDWDWLREWQPNVIRLMLHGSHSDPNSVTTSLIERVHQTCPQAQILLRVWDVDDRNFEAHKAMVQDPFNEARHQLEWWALVFDRVRVPRGLLIAGLNNEVHPSQFKALYYYTKHCLILGSELDVRVGAGVFSTGTPHLPGDGEYDLNKFAELDPLVVEGNHLWLMHEYMQPEGMRGVWTDDQGKERKDYSYLIGRHKRWPIKGNVVIAEWGIEGILYNRNRDPQWGNAGWLNFPELWSAERYADEYVACVQDASPNVIGICPFLSDYADHRWQSADLLPAYGEFLKRKHLCVKAVAPVAPVVVHIPFVSGGVSMSDNWQKSIAFVLKQEGGLSTDPNDPGNYVDGKFIGTKYGISANAHPNVDIVNLTVEQAKEIYHRSYWIPSGANAFEWPLCLAVMDLAVNGGVGRAREALQDAGQDFVKFMAWRIAWYTRIQNFERYGRAWIRRCAELMMAVNA